MFKFFVNFSVFSIVLLFYNLNLITYIFPIIYNNINHLIYNLLLFFNLNTFILFAFKCYLF